MGIKSNTNNADVIDTNKNVNWMDSRGFWTFYALLLGSLYMATPILVPSPHQWTVVNVVHGIVTFGIMHWIKGSPDDSNSMGDYRELTFYEQIDQGHPWTGTKKFLMIVPTALFMLACVTTDYDTVHLCINLPIWAILILAKLPELDRVRIFGINSTVGIDDVAKKGKYE
ncbi:Orm1-like protein, partial [Globisporangium splendens]